MEVKFPATSVIDITVRIFNSLQLFTHVYQIERKKNTRRNLQRKKKDLNIWSHFQVTPTPTWQPWTTRRRRWRGLYCYFEQLLQGESKCLPFFLFSLLHIIFTSFAYECHVNLHLSWMLLFMTTSRTSLMRKNSLMTW